jgi:chromosome segregation ATPase
MTAQKKIADLYQAQTVDLRAQLEEVQTLMTEMQVGMEEMNKEKLEAAEATKAQMAILEKEIEEKDFKIEELNAQLKAINVEAIKEVRSAHDQVWSFLLGIYAPSNGWT